MNREKRRFVKSMNYPRANDHYVNKATNNSLIRGVRMPRGQRALLQTLSKVSYRIDDQHLLSRYKLLSRLHKLNRQKLPTKHTVLER
jgi:hypothetical protein